MECDKKNDVRHTITWLRQILFKERSIQARIGIKHIKHDKNDI